MEYQSISPASHPGNSRLHTHGSNVLTLAVFLQVFFFFFLTNKVIELELNTQVCTIVISWLTFYFWQSCLSMLAWIHFDGGEPMI